MSGSEPTTLARRMLAFCFAVLGSVILITLALELLAQIWGWLVLVGSLVGALWVLLQWRRNRADRW